MSFGTSTATSKASEGLEDIVKKGPLDIAPIQSGAKRRLEEDQEDVNTDTSSPVEIKSKRQAVGSPNGLDDLTSTAPWDSSSQQMPKERATDMAVESIMSQSSGEVIDQNLYSRQIGAFGMETMTRLVQLRCLLCGATGGGVEAAKGLILAGPKEVAIWDPKPAAIADLGSNFYLSEADVGRPRGQAVTRQLAQLNDYVNVWCLEGELTEDVIRSFNVVVVADMPVSEMKRIDEICRRTQPTPVIFIAMNVFGLAANVFCDFGDSFTVYDPDGEEERTAIVSGVTQEKDPVVTLHDNRPMPFTDGDYVSFSEVKGMTELNSLPAAKIQRAGKHTFKVLGVDSSNFGTYLQDGVVKQTKVPKKLTFSSLDTCLLSPLAQGEPCLPVPDLSHFGRSEQLHVIFRGLLKFWDNTGFLPRIRSEEDAAECIRLAKEANEEAKKEAASGREGVVCVDELDEKVARRVAFFARCSTTTLAAVVGNVAAQEVIKATGKFTPLRQLLYVDIFESLTADSEAAKDWEDPGSRYADQIAIYGREMHDRLMNTKLFLVGAGALGCEFLKSFAVMGIGCGPNGKVIVTDMDKIEVSNLNRQFLFRRHHVGQSKSKCAIAAAKVMNPALNATSLENRVGTETEDFFNDRFWEGLDMVVNALDNVPSRLYVDGRCVWHSKPLLESGTLGTKGNVQVVLPLLTESYGSSQDPPEESIPLCTLKNFPYQIEHTIQWARDIFQGLFADAPQETLQCIANSNEYFTKLKREGTSPTQKERVERIYSLLQMGTCSDPLVACVQASHKLFFEYFNHLLQQLLYNYPADAVTSTGIPFWSGPKRPPTPLDFDVADPLHMDCIVSGARLFAGALGIPIEKNGNEAIQSIASKLKPMAFTPRKVKIATEENETEEAGGVDDEHTRDLVIQKITELLPKAAALKVQPLEFEKDDDTNYHVGFVHACANLRARNYSITECSFHKSKMVAGKIVPAIATTTAMVVGLASVELIKVATYEERKLEDFKNAFLNLALPLLVLSEPMPPAKTVDKEFDVVCRGPLKAVPNGFTLWDKIEISIPNCTFRQLIDYLAKTYNVDVSIISYGPVLLLNSFLPKHKERLSQKVKDVAEEVTKTQLPDGVGYVALEVSASDANDDTDVIMPVIKLNFQ